MFQSFTPTLKRGDYADRITRTRAELKRQSLDGFIIPRTDNHQNEFIQPHDARVEWISGFSGSAGICLVLMNKCFLFSDSRYLLQLEREVDRKIFEIIDSQEINIFRYISENLINSKIGFDPWLHPANTIIKAKQMFPKDLELIDCENFIDQIWKTQPKKYNTPPEPHEKKFSGLASDKKKDFVLRSLIKNKADALIITNPQSICWLFNIRGKDIEHLPIVRCFCIFYSSGLSKLFLAEKNYSERLTNHLGTRTKVIDIEEFISSLSQLNNLNVQIDSSSCPYVIYKTANSYAKLLIESDDPCTLPKAVKNATEIRGFEKAHLIDGVAFAKFLYWLYNSIKHKMLDEISIVKKLEQFRIETGQLQDISFDTICASGANGALVHYRVSKETNKLVKQNELLLIDSGGQYKMGTTDVTRTICTGTPTKEMITKYTLVLKGMIALSRLKWPQGLSGKDIDSVARTALWENGLDYGHGTGHGIGSYMSVHEGPHAISNKNNVTLENGMIVSNEPGYYSSGNFGIRIENILLIKAARLKSNTGKNMLDFKTLTLVPLDKKLIDISLLRTEEKNWIDNYHSQIQEKICPKLEKNVRNWLFRFCEPL